MSATNWMSHLNGEVSQLSLIRRAWNPEDDAALVAGLIDALDNIAVRKVSAPEDTPSVGQHLFEALQGVGRKGVVVCGDAPGIGVFTLRADGGAQLYLHVQRILENGTRHPLGSGGTVFMETLTTNPVRDWNAYPDALATVNAIVQAGGVYACNVFSVPRAGSAIA